MSGDSQKRTALVLAGGGSFGAVQAGMLRALVAQGIVPSLQGLLTHRNFLVDPGALRGHTH